MTEELKRCLFCGEQILAIAIKCKHCGEMLNGINSQQSQSNSTPAPSRVKYDPTTDSFSGTTVLMVKLAMRAVQDLGWKIDDANENLGLVTFQTKMSWGSFSGVSCSLNVEELSAYKFRVTGTGKQNVRGGQILAPNLFGEAQSKAKKAIEKMKQLSA